MGKILVLEDKAIDRELIKHLLENKFPDYELIVEESEMACFYTLALERPDFLITDWEFPHNSLIENDQVFNRIIKFKGLVIIYSCHSVNRIKGLIAKKLGYIPKNFRIVNKLQKGGLIDSIIRYNSEKENGLIA